MKALFVYSEPKASNCKLIHPRGCEYKDCQIVDDLDTLHHPLYWNLKPIFDLTALSCSISYDI